jgi:autotransporter-associated beta strand protein
MLSQVSQSSHQTATGRTALRRASLRAVLLATSALAALSASAAHAADATWIGPTGSANFNDNANWSAAQPGSGENATFDGALGTEKNVTFSFATTVGGIAVTSSAGDYTFTSNAEGLTFDGAGLSVGSGASLTLTMNGANFSQFRNKSTAGQATININAGELQFSDTSNAGNSILQVGNPNVQNKNLALEFANGSDASQAQIAVASGAELIFMDQSKGGQANITNTNGGKVSFENTASAGTATINNGGQTTFAGSSTADQATIINNAGGVLLFQNSSSAVKSVITTSGDVFFLDSSAAANASITVNSGGMVLFGQASTADHASINLLAGGVLDISNHNTGIALDALVGSGDVFLGSKNLTAGGNNASTTFSGNIQDGSSPEALAIGFPGGDTGGTLTKVGTGTLTLTGVHNTYTGDTTVNGGALIVDGDISKSSLVRVHAGGILGGTGTVFNTEIDGGTLAPGHDDGSLGKLTVAGDLLFTTTAGSTYLVQVTPTTSTSTSVSGGATLSNATVQALFTPGSYITKKYTILTAGNVNGTFNPLVNTNLSSMFKSSLSYDPNGHDVFLNLDVSGDGVVGGADGAGLNVNQRNVRNAFVNSFNLTNNMLGAFGLLTPQQLTQVSGETAVGTQQATFDAMNQFMGVLLDPTRGALSGGQPNDAMAAMPRKAAPLGAEVFDSRWGVWAAGFGGSQSTNGDDALGSNKTTSNVFGSAVGVDYRFSPNTVLGFELAGGGTHFIVDNGGSGNSDLFQAGAYLRHTQGAAFFAAALAYGWQDVTTNRTVTAFGIDSLRANFTTNAISGRLEGCYRGATAVVDITPYAAGQFTSFHLPSYAEQVAFGANTFALGYSDKDVTATRSELGVRTEKAVPLSDATLMLRGRLAWAHDFNTDRNVQATFLTLPGASFVVNGAAPSADTALTTISAETLWRNGWSTSVTADAQLSDTTRSYSGKGVVRYSW